MPVQFVPEKKCVFLIHCIPSMRFAIEYPHTYNYMRTNNCYWLAAFMMTALCLPGERQSTEFCLQVFLTLFICKKHGIMSSPSLEGK